MVKTKVVQDHSGPIILDKLLRYMSRHVVVHLGKILRINISPHSLESTRFLRKSYRYEEAGRTVGTLEETREQLEPRIISIHDQFTLRLRLHLCKPRILRGKGRARI